jgi:hypothetical protein
MTDLMTNLLITVAYFVAGAGGTAGRIALSPTLPFGLNRRTIAETISGGVAGFVLPYFGGIFAGVAGIDPVTVAGMPVTIKAGLVFLVSGAGSLSIGEILARRGGSNAATPPPPAPGG